MLVPFRSGCVLVLQGAFEVAALGAEQKGSICLRRPSGAELIAAGTVLRSMRHDVGLRSRDRCVNSRLWRLIAAMTAALACGSVAAAAVSRGVAFRVRFPGLVTLHTPGSQSVHGDARLSIPSSWTQGRSSDGGTVGHLTVRLARRCDARIRVSPGVDATNQDPAQQITDAMDFWFGFVVPVPPPIPRAAQHISKDRAWSLGTPPPEYRPAPRGTPAAGTASPYYGVAVQRVARPNRWAWVIVAVETPVSCWKHPPNRAPFESALKTMLQTATFNVTLGRVKHGRAGRTTG